MMKPSGFSPCNREVTQKSKFFTTEHTGQALSVIKVLIVTDEGR